MIGGGESGEELVVEGCSDNQKPINRHDKDILFWNIQG